MLAPNTKSEIDQAGCEDIHTPDSTLTTSIQTNKKRTTTDIFTWMVMAWAESTVSSYAISNEKELSEVQFGSANRSVPIIANECKD